MEPKLSTGPGNLKAASAKSAKEGGETELTRVALQVFCFGLTSHELYVVSTCRRRDEETRCVRRVITSGDRDKRAGGHGELTLSVALS